MKWFRRRRPDGPLTCKEVARVLQGYLDGEVAPTVARDVADHLDDCVDCNFEAHVYDEIKAALRRRARDVPEDSVARLVAFGHELLEADTGA